MRHIITAQRVPTHRSVSLTRPRIAIAASFVLAALIVTGCTAARQTLPPDAAGGGTGGRAMIPLGVDLGGEACDAADCPVIEPTCLGPSCDGGAPTEGPIIVPPDFDAGAYPTECPGGVKTFWDLSAEVSALDFSPDGAFVASGSRDGTVQVHRIVDGSEFARNTKHRQNIQAVRFSHGGLALAAASEDGSLTLWNVGPQAPRVWVHGSFVYAVAFSSDDVTMAVGAQRGVYMIRTATLASALRLETQLFNRSVAFLPGDLELLVAYGETAGQLVVLKALDLTLARMVAQHIEPIVRVAIPQAKATHFVFATGNFLRVNLISTNMSYPFDQHVKRIEDLRFSSDGGRIVTGAGDATRVWSSSDWSVQRSFGPSAAVAFSPDGKRLARAEGRRVLVHCLDRE